MPITFQGLLTEGRRGANGDVRVEHLPHLLVAHRSPEILVVGEEDLVHEGREEKDLDGEEEAEEEPLAAGVGRQRRVPVAAVS